MADNGKLQKLQETCSKVQLWVKTAYHKTCTTKIKQKQVLCNIYSNTSKASSQRVNAGKQFKKESEISEETGDFSCQPTQIAEKLLKEGMTKMGNMYLRLLTRTSLIIPVFK
jgi:hypothetical protein